MIDDVALDETADPARAFEDLRAEVSVLRRAVEGLPKAWSDNRPPDYSRDLGRMAKVLEGVRAHLTEIERHPALLLTPEEHRQAVISAGSSSMRAPLESLSRAVLTVEQERFRLTHELEQIVGQALSKREQTKELWWFAGIALALGLLASPIVAAVFPFGLNTFVAAFILKTDRWSAGETMMSAANASGWRDLSSASDLVRANADRIKACREAATKGESSPCKIIVSAPEGTSNGR